MKKRKWIDVSSIGIIGVLVAFCSRDAPPTDIKGGSSVPSSGPAVSIPDEILQLCRSSELEQRSSAAASFALAGKQALRDIQTGLADASPNCRWSAAGAAALLGAEASPILDLLQTIKASDSSPSVRQMAQMAANRVGGAAAGEPPNTVSMDVDPEPGSISFSVRPGDMLQALKNVLEKKRSTK